VPKKGEEIAVQRETAQKGGDVMKMKHGSNRLHKVLNN